MSTAIVGVACVAIHPHDPTRILVVTESRSNAAIGKNAGMLSLPAGHIHANEPLQEAMLRELAEETGYEGTIQSLIGIYQTTGSLGVAFLVHVNDVSKSRTATDEIASVEWKTVDTLIAAKNSLRPGMLKVLLDYQANTRYPTSLIQSCL